MHTPIRFTALLLAALVALSVGATEAVPASAAVTSTGYKHVTAKANADGTITVTWRKTLNAKKYIVRTSNMPDMSKNVVAYSVKKSRKTTVVKPTSTAGVSSGNYTFIRVYVVRKNGSVSASPYAAVRLRPAAVSTSAKKITVATFNVRTNQNQQSGHTWAQRKRAVATRILGSNADVVAVQEAGGVTGTGCNATYQFTELAALIRDKYVLATLNNETTCAIKKEQYAYTTGGGGKQGTRIFYNPTTYTQLRAEYFTPSSPNSDSRRFVPYVLLQNRQTGETVYVMSVHLENRKGATYDRVRLAQAQEVIAKAKALSASKKIQVIVAGDLNSNIYSSPNNRVQWSFVTAGFYDAYATAKNTNEFRVTFNGFTTPSKVSASRTDYILSYGPYRGSYSYKNWISSVNGVIPSDHNMQTATVPY